MRARRRRLVLIACGQRRVGAYGGRGPAGKGHRPRRGVRKRGLRLLLPAEQHERAAQPVVALAVVAVQLNRAARLRFGLVRLPRATARQGQEWLGEVRLGRRECPVGQRLLPNRTRATPGDGQKCSAAAARWP